jgi:hypothetical protein
MITENPLEAKLHGLARVYMYVPGCANCASCATWHVLIGRRSSLLHSLDAQKKDPAENDLGTDVECRIPANLARRKQEGPMSESEKGGFLGRVQGSSVGPQGKTMKVTESASPNDILFILLKA